jgi:hypothetical protein
MNCGSRILYAAIPLVAAALLTPGPARAGNDALSKSATYTVGDAIAVRTQGILRTVAGLDASTLVYYDRETHTIVVEIVGGTDDVEGAKREIEGYVDAIRGKVSGYAKKQLHVDLSDRDVTLIYYNTTDEDQAVEVVRRENGAYVISKPAEEEDNGE